MIDKILANITEFRKQKRFSNEVMAHELSISTAAYRKIEFNQTKLTVEKLIKISQILEVDIANLLDIKSKIELHQTNKDNSTGYLQQIENYHQENKELTENFVKSLQSEIALLRDLLSKKND
jgi:transcriptional regulator with XRE-family HTH domain